jgi:arabinoxylan arabinofuranohydrolase
MKPSEILGALVGIALAATTAVHAANPIITNVFTADPAPFVYKNTVYLYVGQDEAKSSRTRTVIA